MYKILRAINGVGLDVIAFRERMLFVDLDEHGFLAVDHHGMHDRDIKLPVIRDVLGLGEGEVMTLGPRKDLHYALVVGTHYTNGDVDLVFPRLRRIIF